MKLILYSLGHYLVTILILFISAGTIHYPEGWFYIVSLFLISSGMSYYFLKTDLELVERRMKKEEDKTQKIIRVFLVLMYVATYIVAGLDYRFKWSDLPRWMEVLSLAGFLAGYTIVFFVFKENSYTASNIKAYKNQKVICTGVYSQIRHPMYSGSFLIIMASPFMLGSSWALIPSIIICLIIVYRAKEEERILSRDLDGYEEYLKIVKDRFIPGII